MKAQLPQTSVKADAIEFARQGIKYYRENPLRLYGVPVHVLDPIESRRHAIIYLKRQALSDTAWMIEIVRYAREGWDLAQGAMHELINEFENHFQPLPGYLAAYSIDLREGNLSNRISGPKRVDKLFRDWALCVIVARVIQKFGLKPTRNRAYPHQPCACAIVAEAVFMSERRIEKIWQKCDPRLKSIVNSMPLASEKLSA
jgi:hypothetical protein